MDNLKYDVVHIVTNGEYKAPLVAVQVFDRAQVQATAEGVGKPCSVSVWIMVPMREVFNKDCQHLVKSLQERCPGIKIKMVGGISRLNEFPSLYTLKRLRKSLKNKTIYHCRGESSYYWATLIKKEFNHDVIVLDVRGFTPLERYVNDNVFNVKDLSADQRKVYDAELTKLKTSIQNSDFIFTVSEPLRQYLISNLNAPGDTGLIPCCVKNIIADTNRENIRRELNIQNKTAILYLGGTQKYQHLEDLVIPFIKSAISQSEDNIGVFITQNKDAMMRLLRKFEITESKIRVVSVEQSKVADYLTAMDIGLLLRSPNDLNNFSQPVKFGEYLSAGIPVVIEKGTGGIAGILNEYKIGYVVSLSDKENQNDFDKEVKKAIEWCETNGDAAKINAKKFVEEHYTWKANVQKERKLYLDALQKVK